MTRFNFLLAAIIVCLLVFSCKKNESNETPPSVTYEQLAAQINLLDKATLQYKLYEDTLNDPLNSILKMAHWLLQQPDVDAAYIIDESIIQVTFKSGLKSSISVIAMDENGAPLTRGGGSKNANDKLSNRDASLMNFGSVERTTGGSQVIGNKKVLIFAPYRTSMYIYSGYGGYPYMSKFTQGPVPLEATLIADDEADLATVNTFSDYGFIILDTHGDPSGFLIETKIYEFDIPAPPGGMAYTEESLKELIGQAANFPLDKIANGQIEIAFEINQGATILRVLQVKVTDNYIRGLQHLDKAVVFGNYCYSGYTFDGTSTRNMAEAFKSIGAVSYYGYAYDNGESNKAENDFAIEMEDSLITNLVINGDSTGIAHLKNDVTLQQDPNHRRTGGTMVKIPNSQWSRHEYTAEYPEINDPFYFKHFFEPTYAYGCGMFTDLRDDETYKLVCIGDQRWFAENLRYNAPGSLFARNEPSKIKEYGKLYNYPTASAGQGATQGNATIQGICPQGWHIPTLSDWRNVETTLNAASNAELAILLLSKSPSWGNDTWGDDPDLADPKRNESGFNAMSAGSASKSVSMPAQYYDWGAEFVLSTADTTNSYLHPMVLSLFLTRAKLIDVRPPHSIVTAGQTISNQVDESINYKSCRCVENK